MTDPTTRTPAARLRAALGNANASTRLQAALTAGTRPNDTYIDVLVERCAIEPDFFVRDMLTWALTRHDPAATIAALARHLHSPLAQARSQALHTLSKIGDPATWSLITVELLRDEEGEVARAAWRTAAQLVPDDRKARLAAELAGQLGRGDDETQRSLSRAFGMIADAAEVVIQPATHSDNPRISAHALATLTVMADPDSDFEAALTQARRVVALRSAPSVPES